jgi:hypothetical protein
LCLDQRSEARAGATVFRRPALVARGAPGLRSRRPPRRRLPRPRPRHAAPYRAVDGVVLERRPPEQPPDPTVTDDSGVLPAVFVDHDHDVLDVGEGAVALSIGIAGGAAGGEAQWSDCSVARGRRRSRASVGADRSGEAAARFAPGVVQRAARQQPDVPWRHARRSHRPDRSAGGFLAGICLGEAM